MPAPGHRRALKVGLPGLVAVILSVAAVADAATPRPQPQPPTRPCRAPGTTLPPLWLSSYDFAAHGL